GTTSTRSRCATAPASKRRRTTSRLRTRVSRSPSRRATAKAGFPGSPLRALISPVDYTRRRLVHTVDRLRSRTYAERRPVDELLVSARVDRISWQDAQQLEYRQAVLGEHFGPLFSTYW